MAAFYQHYCCTSYLQLLTHARRCPRTSALCHLVKRATPCTVHGDALHPLTRSCSLDLSPSFILFATFPFRSPVSVRPQLIHPRPPTCLIQFPPSIPLSLSPILFNPASLPEPPLIPLSNAIAPPPPCIFSTPFTPSQNSSTISSSHAASALQESLAQKPPSVPAPSKRVTRKPTEWRPSLCRSIACADVQSWHVCGG